MCLLIALLDTMNDLLGISLGMDRNACDEGQLSSE